MCPRYRIFVDNGGGWCIVMTGLSNWQPWRRLWQRKTRPRSWRQHERRKLSKQNIQCVSLNISNGGCAGVFTGRLRSQQFQQRRQKRKQKIQHVWVNVSNCGGASVFKVSGYWRQWRRWQIKTWTQTQQQRRRRWQRTRNTWLVREIGDNDGGGGGQTTGPRNLWRQRRRRMKKIINKTKKRQQGYVYS